MCSAPAAPAYLGLLRNSFCSPRSILSFFFLSFYTPLFSFFASVLRLLQLFWRDLREAGTDPVPGEPALHPDLHPVDEPVRHDPGSVPRPHHPQHPSLQKGH